MEYEYDKVQALAEQYGQLTARLQRAGSDTATVLMLNTLVADLADDMRKLGMFEADGLTVAAPYREAYEKGLREG